MGLDIGFNRKKAEEAGMVFEILPNNGTYSDKDDQDYIDWCNASNECIKVPYTDHYVQNDSGSSNKVIVRANMWGNTYYPLTRWLQEHNIKWDEF